MNHLKILSLTLLTLFALGCNPPPGTPDAAPLIAEDSPALTTSGPRDVLFTRPRSSLFVPASPDTRSHSQIEQAACTGFPDATHWDGWRCAGKKPVTFAATGNSPIIPISWTVPAWFVDPQNTSATASDKNDCVTAATACRTYQEISVHRWGCLGNPKACPRLRQSTAIEFISSHTNNTDPVYFYPTIESGAVVQIFGPLGTSQQIATGTIPALGFVAKARATNTLLQANTGATAVGQLVINATRANSRAWTYKSLGAGVFSLTEPSAPAAVPGACGAGNDLWASGDTVTAFQPVAVNLVDVSAVFDQLNGGNNNNVVYLYNLTGFDPSSFNLLHLSNATLTESFSTRFVKIDGTPGIGYSFCNNEYNQGVSGGTNTTSLTFNAGAMGLSAQQSNLINPIINNDIILASTTSVGTTIANGSQGSPVYIESTKTLTILSGGFNGTSSIWWGAGTINVTGSSRFVYTATAVTNLLAPLKINNATTACGHSAANNPDVLNCAITVNAANLDAAQGVAGFGGLAFLPGGGSITTGGL